MKDNTNYITKHYLGGYNGNKSKLVYHLETPLGGHEYASGSLADIYNYAKSKGIKKKHIKALI